MYWGPHAWVSLVEEVSLVSGSGEISGRLIELAEYFETLGSMKVGVETGRAGLFDQVRRRFLGASERLVRVTLLSLSAHCRSGCGAWFRSDDGRSVEECTMLCAELIAKAPQTVKTIHSNPIPTHSAVLAAAEIVLIHSGCVGSGRRKGRLRACRRPAGAHCETQA